MTFHQTRQVILQRLEGSITKIEAQTLEAEANLTMIPNPKKIVRLKTDKCIMIKIPIGKPMSKIKREMPSKFSFKKKGPRSKMTYLKSVWTVLTPNI